MFAVTMSRLHPHAQSSVCSPQNSLARGLANQALFSSQGHSLDTGKDMSQSSSNALPRSSHESRNNGYPPPSAYEQENDWRNVLGSEPSPSSGFHEQLIGAHSRPILPTVTRTTLLDSQARRVDGVLTRVRPLLDEPTSAVSIISGHSGLNTDATALPFKDDTTLRPLKSKKRREKPRIELSPDQPPTTQGKQRARVYVACLQW
jgi:hypothetical protein